MVSKQKIGTFLGNFVHFRAFCSDSRSPFNIHMNFVLPYLSFLKNLVIPVVINKIGHATMSKLLYVYANTFICMQTGFYYSVYLFIKIYFQSYNSVPYRRLNRPNEQIQWKFTA